MSFIVSRFTIIIAYIFLIFFFHLLWWMILSKVYQICVQMLEKISFNVLIIAFHEQTYFSSLEESSPVLSSSSSNLALELEAFKKILILYFLILSLFCVKLACFEYLQLDPTFIGLSKECRYIKIFKSCDSFMDVTFGCHSLHIDINTLLG